MATGPFQTQKFQDIEGPNFNPTTEVQPSSAHAGNIVSAALPGIDKLMDLKQEEYKRDLAEQTERDLRSSIVAPTEVFADEVQEGRDPLALLNSKEGLRHALTRELGSDVNIDDPRIDEAVSTFKRLALAKADGKVLPDRVRTIALAKMKQMINQNPLFTDEIKAAAKATLKFDPSGADLQEALNILGPREKEKRQLTPEEAARQGYLKAIEAGEIATSVTFPEWQQSVNKSFLEKTRRDNILRQSEDAVMIAQQGLGLIHDASAEIMRGVTNSMLKDIEAGGGTTNPETEAANYRIKMTASYNELRTINGFSQMKFEDQSALNRVFNDMVRDNEEMIKSGALKNLLNSRIDTVKSLLLSELYKDSHLGAIHAIAGEDGLLTYVDIMARYPNRPEILNAIRNLGGKFAGLESYGELGNGTATALQKILGNEPLTDEDLEFGKLTARPMVEDTNPNKSNNTVIGLRNGLGDGVTLEAFDSDKAVMATANNPRQKADFNNLYSSMSAEVFEGLPELLASNPDVTIKVEEQVQSRRNRPDIKKKVFVVESKATGRKGRREVPTGRLSDAVNELNSLLSITNRYSRHGLIQGNPTEKQFLDQVDKILKGEDPGEDTDTKEQ